MGVVGTDNDSLEGPVYWGLELQKNDALQNIS